jgi:TRAP-type mannitol/chloroaromatic compound transport system permease small subunit
MTNSLVTGGLAGLVIAAILVGIAFSQNALVSAALLAVDRFSTLVGQVFSWTILLLTAVITYEVVARRFFSAPTNWGYDVQYMLYGTLFMFAGAYALSRNGHVRGDFLYRMMPARRQASLDLLLYILFFFPAIFAFMVAGWHFFELSWMQNERSMFSPSGRSSGRTRRSSRSWASSCCCRGWSRWCAACAASAPAPGRSACRTWRSWTRSSSPRRPSATPRTWPANSPNAATAPSPTRAPDPMISDAGLGLTQLILFLFFILWASRSPSR